MRDHNGDHVSPSDVLSDEDLREYYRNKDRHPSRAFTPSRRSWIRDEMGYVSEDGGQTWRHEGETG